VGGALQKEDPWEGAGIPVTGDNMDEAAPKRGARLYSDGDERTDIGLMTSLVLCEETGQITSFFQK
jgi:hypothetical protein